MFASKTQISEFKNKCSYDHIITDRLLMNRIYESDARLKLHLMDE